MKIDFKNPTIKSTALTLLFYVSSVLLSILLSYNSHPGPCSPPPGFIVIIFLPFISFILLLVNFNKIKQGDKTKKYSAWIHFIVVLIFLLLYFLLSLGVLK